MAAAVLALCGCAARDSAGTDAGVNAGGNAAAQLRYIDDRTSESFGTVQLGPFRSPTAPASASASASASSEGFSVWTGAAALSPTSCAHPESQATVLGRLQRHGETLRFRPRLPFAAGTTYSACVDLRRLGHTQPQSQRAVLQLTFTPSSGAASAAPTVSEVWPSSSEVPANLLRFYITFSQPMHTRSISEHVQLIGTDGTPIADAFVDIPNGLWDAQARRLTLFVHPGRIKRGVGPRTVQGPVLTTGHRVTLRIERPVLAQNGLGLAQPFERHFTVIDADRASPDPTAWSLRMPLAAHGAVTVDFDEQLDRAQLMRFVTAHHSDTGEAIPGSAQTSLDGRSWSFTPREPWPATEMIVEVQPLVEDLAGNSVGRLFDEETGPSAPLERVSPHPTASAPVRLPFKVGRDG